MTTTPTTQELTGDGRRSDLAAMTPGQLLAHARKVRADIVRYQRLVDEARAERTALSDEIHRFRQGDVADWRIEPLAENIWGIRFQTLRPLLERHWAEIGVDYQPAMAHTLLPSEEEDIRRRYAAGGRGNAKYTLAKEYHVKRETVAQLVEGIVPAGRVSANDTRKIKVRKPKRAAAEQPAGEEVAVGE